MANQLSEDEKYYEALQYYKNILLVDPVNITAIIDYGVTLQNLARLKHALEMYDIALTIQPKNILALINKGTVLHTMEKYSEAISCYNTVLRIDKRNTMAIVCKGLSFGEMGNITSAIKYFKKQLSEIKLIINEIKSPTSSTEEASKILLNYLSLIHI